MTWEVTSIIITSIITVAAFLLRFLPSSNSNKREIDVAWREGLASKISHIETQQDNLENSLNRFKDDVKGDIEGIRKLLLNGAKKND